MPNLDEIQKEIDCLIERGMKDWNAAREFVKAARKKAVDENA
jgi:hypothetical protein